MRRIDELHLDYPFAGSRMLRDLLATEGIIVGRLHVSTLMIVIVGCFNAGTEALAARLGWNACLQPDQRHWPALIRRLLRWDLRVGQHAPRAGCERKLNRLNKARILSLLVAQAGVERPPPPGPPRPGGIFFRPRAEGTATDSRCSYCRAAAAVHTLKGLPTIKSISGHVIVRDRLLLETIGNPVWSGQSGRSR